MIGTIAIAGTSEEVMAPLGLAGTFIKGKRQAILVTGVGFDKQTPLIIRESLVGLQISCIFTKKQIGERFDQIPSGALIAYCSEIIETLCAAKKHDAAAALKEITDDPLDLYVFEPENFQLLEG